MLLRTSPTGLTFRFLRRTGGLKAVNVRALSHAKVDKAGPLKNQWEAPRGHICDFTVYNSLAKRKTPLVTELQNVVKWYSCGPTVYDHAHIGHAFCYVRFDMIRRILESENMSVIYAMNITDIDDKIFRKSLQLKRHSLALAQEYEASFFQDLNSLNVLPPSLVLRVSEFMPIIIEFVHNLLDSNYAYQTPNGINFDTAKDPNYPRFRYVEPTGGPANEKRNSADFALWKSAKPSEPFWDSPFGPGRPGWHVECSALASKIFGSSVDIHSGGKDLEFPHHENEEAQSCAFHSCSNWAKFFLHSGHVIINAEKMSKSLGNALTIKDFLTNSSSDEFRMMCLRLPYRLDIHFTHDLVARSKNALAKISSVLSACDDYLRGRFVADINEEQLLRDLSLTQLKVCESFKDDFDLPEATSAVLNLVQTLATKLEDTGGRTASAVVAVTAARSYIRKYFETLGLNLNGRGEKVEGGAGFKSIIDNSVQFRQNVRTAALAMKSDERVQLLKLCDVFRDTLKQQGVTVKDKAGGSSWSMK